MTTNVRYSINFVDLPAHPMAFFQYISRAYENIPEGTTISAESQAQIIRILSDGLFMQMPSALLHRVPGIQGGDDGHRYGSSSYVHAPGDGFVAPAGGFGPPQSVNGAFYMPNDGEELESLPDMGDRSPQGTPPPLYAPRAEDEAAYPPPYAPRAEDETANPPPYAPRAEDEAAYPQPHQAMEGTDDDAASDATVASDFLTLTNPPATTETHTEADNNNNNSGVGDESATAPSRPHRQSKSPSNHSTNGSQGSHTTTSIAPSPPQAPVTKPTAPSNPPRANPNATEPVTLRRSARLISKRANEQSAAAPVPAAPTSSLGKRSRTTKKTQPAASLGKRTRNTADNPQQPKTKRAKTTKAKK